MRYLIFLLFLGSHARLGAKAITSSDTRSLRLHFGVRQQELGVRRQERRPKFGLSYWDNGMELLPIGYSITASYVPGLNDSRSVRVKRDSYTMTTMLRVSYPKLFRFSVLLGPGYQLSRSSFDVFGNKDVEWSHRLLAASAIVVDYEFSDSFGICYLWHRQYLFADAKSYTDHSLGILWSF